MAKGDSMKKLIIVFLIFATSFPLFAQMDHNQIIERFLDQRKKMMEEIMKAFDDDSFFKDDFFDDDKIFDSFKFQGFRGSGENVKIEEVMEKDGTISIFITPLNQNQKLDIKTTSDAITIKAETMVDQKEEGKKGVSQSYYKSSFSRSIGIPDGYSAKSPVKVGEKIKISLIPNEKNPLRPNEDGRIPVPKSEGEKTI